MIPEQPGMQTQQGVPSMMQPQQQVDPAIQQISQFFTAAMEQGAKPEEVVMNLMQQEVDQGTIAQALMTVGYAEQDITILFENVQRMGQPGKASAQEVNANPQQLARNQELAQQQQGPVSVDPIEMAKSGIEIKPENKGKFTRWAKARGMSVSEAYNKVMGNTDAYPPSVVKMANFAKNAAGWKKEEGGEPDNKGFRALPDFVQNKIMKRQTGGEEETETDESKLTDEQKSENEMRQKFLEASNVTLTNQNNQIIGGKNPNSVDEGVLQNKNYFNPNAFKTGNNFSLGKAANVLNNSLQDMFAGDRDGDGLKDGSFRDWKNKAINNKINKELDANYKVELDLSDENKAAAQAWKMQYDIENPEVDELGNVVEKDIIDNPLEVTNTPIQQVTENFSNWFESNTDKLTEKAKNTYDALIKKMRGADEVEEVDEEITVQAYGSEIPIAQFSVPDSGAPFANPITADEPLSMQEWVMEDPVTRGTADGETRYKEYVDGFSSNNFGTETIPSLPVTKLEVPELQDSPTQRTAADLFTDIKMPEVTKNYGGLEGFIDRTINSNVARGVGDIADFAVKGVDVLNDFYEDRNIEDAKDDLRGKFVADNIYGTKTDAFNKRGTFDINSGIMGSEGDRTTGLYMSKQGGGVNNPGFKALPPQAQHNILSNMAYGGAKGAEAYLANKDRVIKREMAKAQDGNKEYKEAFNNAGGNFSKRETKSIIQNMINNYGFNNETDTIISSGAPSPARGNSRNRALSNKMYEAGYEGDVDYNNIFDIIPNSPFTMDQVSFMSIPKNQKGGETVNVDSTMLAKLIAAGADIEML